MSCSDITAFEGETRDAEGGTVELAAIGALNEALITIITPWGSKDSITKIALNETLTYTSSNKSYTVKLTNIAYSSYKKEYYCKFEVCYTEETTGSIYCNPSQMDALIYLDGSNQLQYTPHTITNLTPGSHYVDFYKAGYNTCRATVTVTAGGTVTASCTMTIIPTTGSILCTTFDESGNEISGAKIFLDTVHQNKVTPYTLTNITPGFYKLNYEKDGYVGCWKDNVEVKAGYVSGASCILVLKPTTGSLSITSDPTGAAIHLDGEYTGKFTGTSPVIISDLVPGTHTVICKKSGYNDSSPVQQDVISGTTRYVHCTLTIIPLEGPGFDITVNIPGLLPDSSLYIAEVTKIPLTDTWWDSPFGAGMRWDTVSNGLYKAKVLKADCVPEPDLHSGFRIGQDYVIYVGTSSVSLFPGRLVHRAIDDVVSVDITESYIDWISSSLCNAFEISPAQCSNFIFTSVNDAAFLLELWLIITKHENLAGEETLPTALDYALVPIAILGIFSPGISEGKIAQIAGKRITKLLEIANKSPDNIQDVIRHENINSFILRATTEQFDELIRFIDEGLEINAQFLLKQVDEIPLSSVEVSALDRAAKLIEQMDKSLTIGSLEHLSIILSKFNIKFKNIFIRALAWTKAHPKQALAIGILAIWFMIDNLPFYIYMFLKAIGADPSARSWQGKTYIDIIDGYKFNTNEAQRLEDWDLFCTNLKLWEDEVNAFEDFITEYESVLTNEQTYDLYVSTISVHREGIILKNEKHSCVPTVLPTEFTAEVTEIIDGDTIDIDYEGEIIRVRLLGINTPESKTYKDYSCIPGTHPFLVRRLEVVGGDCGDEEIWNTNQDNYDDTVEWLGKIEGGNIPARSTATFKTDLNNQYDKYGRLLAIIINKDAHWVNKISLSSGQSTVFFYSENSLLDKSTRDSLLALERLAKDANIGIWPFKAEKGWVKFISDPTAADVYLDDVYIGKTVSNTLLIETTVGTHTYEFKKVGYIGCKGTILEVNTTHTENDPFERTCTLRLEEPPCPSPNASFVIGPTSPDVNENITFDASASTAGGDESIDSYTWDFGDGTNAIGRVVTHAYVTPGSFIAKLTIRNDCRETDVSTKTITINPIIDIGDLTVKTYSAPGVLLTGVVAYLDNLDKGSPPVTIKNLTVGSHSIRLEKTGYLGCASCEGVACTPGATITPCDFTVVIEKDVTKVLEVTMQKVFLIEITSDPTGATITVDNGEPLTASISRIGGLNLIEQILKTYPVTESTTSELFLRKLNRLR